MRRHDPSRSAGGERRRARVPASGTRRGGALPLGALLLGALLSLAPSRPGRAGDPPAPPPAAETPPPAPAPPGAPPAGGAPAPVTPPASPEGGTATAVLDADGVLRMPGLRLDVKRRRVEVDGRICIQRGLLEVVACTRIGKTHESLLVLDCRPRDLKASLLALGLSDRPQVKNFGDPGELSGEKVAITVLWECPDGPREARVEDLILDSVEGRPMERRGFVFTGSRFVRVGDREMFMSDASGQIVTTYHDPDAILDNPSTKGGDDTVYYANSKDVPRAGTPVRAVFEPIAAGDERAGAAAPTPTSTPETPAGPTPPPEPRGD